MKVLVGAKEMMEPLSFGARGQNEALWDWNLVSNRIHFSPVWLALIGCQEHEIGNSPDAWLQRVHPEDRANVSAAIEAQLENGPDALELRHRMLHQDGAYRWVMLRGVIQRDTRGRAARILGFHADVTAEEVSDPVTGLPNQLLLVERLARSIERVQKYPGFHFALLCVDIQRPDAPDAKQARVTDPFLTAVARRLETCLRVREVHPTLRNNDLVARLEGDRFAVLLDGLKDIGHATVAAERILAEILVPYPVNGRDLRVSASIGIALSATGYTSADAVLRDADTAQHRAALLGGKRCEVFDTGVLQLMNAELRLEGDLEGALERNEFVLFYQPIVSLASNHIVGFEALVRWQHPGLGLILPLEFVPLAEKTGFIVPLGRWVLRQACLQLKAWQSTTSNTADLWMSVNLSSVQFKQAGLVEDITAIVEEAGLEPRCLVLELTESTAMENPVAVQNMLMQIRALGVRVSVDDFGTGHSALAYLRQLPLDSLKIDRSFVRGIEANQDMASIFEAVSTMTRQLGLQVVAEGIEKDAQLETIRSLNCDFGQGFLFSKPLDSDQAAAMLAIGLELQPPPAVAERPHRAPKAVGRAPWTMKSAYAAAAVLIVVASIGLPGYLSEASRPSLPAAPQPGAGREALARPLPPEVQIESPPAVAVPVPLPGPAPAGPVALPSPAPAVAATETAEAVAPPAPAREEEPMSLRVVHQHRIGNCRGVLHVSRDGVAYVPDGRAGENKDAFSIALGQFLHALEGDSLTIRSNDRAYRFKAADGEGTFSDLVERLAALRKAAS